MVFPGFLVVYNGVSHGVWYGTGDFKGWDYTVDEEYIDGTSQGIVAFLLIPLTRGITLFFCLSYEFSVGISEKSGKIAT